MHNHQDTYKEHKKMTELEVAITVLGKEGQPEKKKTRHVESSTLYSLPYKSHTSHMKNSTKVHWQNYIWFTLKKNIKTKNGQLETFKVFPKQ